MAVPRPREALALEELNWDAQGKGGAAELMRTHTGRGEGGGVSMKNGVWSGLGRRELCSWELALSAWEPLPAMFSHACLEAAPQQKLECQTGTGAQGPVHPFPLDWAQALIEDT